MIPAMFFSFVAYIVLQVVCLKTLKGNWRKAAIVSSIIGVAVILYTAIAAFMGSNLFPLLLLFSGPFLFLYVTALLVLNKLVAKNETNNL